MYLGFCFAPTGEEHYLYLVKKVKGMRIPSDLIPKHDIYEEEPWKMFDHFMTLKKIKSRVQWTAGQGTWKGQNKVEIKNSQGEQVGSGRLFSFEMKSSSSKTDGKAAHNSLNQQF